MIVISNPIKFNNEIDIIHSLFEEGLSLFHVRKLDFSEKEMKAYLSDIKIDFRQHLVLHSHHQLAEDFGINSIHFTEENRKNTTEDELLFWREKQFKVSTSVHEITTFNTLNSNFEYAFCSPVYHSISKENYFPDYDFFIEIKKKNQLQDPIGGFGRNFVYQHSTDAIIRF